MKLRILISTIAALALVAVAAIAGNQDPSTTPIVAPPPQAIVVPSLPSLVASDAIEQPVQAAVSSVPDDFLPRWRSPWIACQGNSPIRHRSRRDEPPPVSVA